MMSVPFASLVCVKKEILCWMNVLVSVQTKVLLRPTQFNSTQSIRLLHYSIKCISGPIQTIQQTCNIDMKLRICQLLVKRNRTQFKTPFPFSLTLYANVNAWLNAPLLKKSLFLLLSDPSSSVLLKNQHIILHPIGSL